jgi:ribosomal protein L37AE/L43A
MTTVEHEDIVIEDTTTALAVRAPVALSVTPDVTAEDLVTRLDVIRAASQNAMVENVDYGVIPGTDKPTLLKPGAEKLGVLFQLDVQLANEKERDGEHLTVTSRATVYHAPTGARLGYGEGICSTYEKKYRWRNADRFCPVCNQATVLRSKNDGSWFCWKKRGGCGANFNESDPQIVNQKAGKVENPELPDLWNTVLKMAEKRARVDAILAVTGASALFTQDVEDAASPAAEPEWTPPPSDVPPALAPEPEEDPARAALVGEILGLAEKLGKLDAKSAEIAKMRGKAGEMEWLRGQLNKAHDAVKAKERAVTEADS